MTWETNGGGHESVEVMDFLKILNGRREVMVVWMRFSETHGVSCVKEEYSKPTDKDSGSDSLVAMMRTPEDKDGDDLSLVRALDFPGDWAVAIERTMGGKMHGISFDPFIPYAIPYLGKGICETTIEASISPMGFCKRLIGKTADFWTGRKIQFGQFSIRTGTR